MAVYNEEANLGRLIGDLLSQKEENFVLTEIIVCSDGSRDRTAGVAGAFADPRIKIIRGRKRLGLARRQNQIFKKARAEVLVVLQGDIALKDPLFLSKLAAPVIKGEADLVAGRLKELPVRSLLERVLSESCRIKREIFEKFEEGQNLYTCHGPARAFSQRLYQKIRFPQSVGEDAYSYLFCQSLGFHYSYARKATAYYQLPQNFADHQKQSLRFFGSISLMAEIFGSPFISSHYRLPRKLILKFSANFLYRQPAYALIYALILIFLKLKSLFIRERSQTWEIAESSKALKV